MTEKRDAGQVFLRLSESDLRRLRALATPFGGDEELALPLATVVGIAMRMGLSVLEKRGKRGVVRPK